MAGTLTISTLSDGTNSTSSTNCIQGSAKAWVRWTYVSSLTILKSYNVTSITRSAAGFYLINFTTALTDANYVAIANGGSASGSTTAGSAVQMFVNASGNLAPTTSQFGINTLNASAVSNIDPLYVNIAVFD